MPAKSAKQWGFMQAKAHNDLMGAGPSKEVAQEFIDKTPATKRSKFAKALMKKRKLNGR